MSDDAMMAGGGPQAIAMRALAIDLSDSVSREGWHIEVVEQPGGYQFLFKHELTHDLSYLVPHARLADARDLLSRFMSTDRDIISIGKRPADIEHAEILVGLRSAAANLSWSPKTLSEVGLVLCELGLLTLDEAEWLSEAGPAT